MIQYIFKGTDRLAAKLDKFDSAIEKIVGRELKRAGYLVKRQAQINVTNVVLRRRHGLLGSSITNVLGVVDGKQAAIVGTDVVYAPTHEFGAVITNGFGRGILLKIPRRPWLSRAMEESRAEIYEMFSTAISMELRETGLK